jgi:hypothetical protein
MDDRLMEVYAEGSRKLENINSIGKMHIFCGNRAQVAWLWNNPIALLHKHIHNKLGLDLLNSIFITIILVDISINKVSHDEKKRVQENAIFPKQR